MQTCPECHHEIDPEETFSGRCRACGADLLSDKTYDGAKTYDGSGTYADKSAAIDSAQQTILGDIPEDDIDSDPKTIAFDRKTAELSDVFDAADATIMDDSQPVSPRENLPQTGVLESGGDWADVTMRLSEADLPEAKRSILSFDRTIGMDGVEITGTDAHKTEVDSVSSVAQTPSKGATRVPDSKLIIPTRSLLRTSPELKNPEPPHLADYRIERELGHGGMGVVWLARQTSLDREVAIKQIRFSSNEGLSDKRRQASQHSFLAEAMVTSDLSHPNIVPVYDLGQDPDGNLLYSMKCVRGTAWDELIENYSEADNLEILRKVADAIAFAHSRGVIHRDLKPSNIMVGSYGEVLVMDWGTAFPMTHYEKASGFQSVAARAGTFAYMPPEQVQGDISRIGPHSDIYLLGAILFEIITGSPPHPMLDSTGSSLSTKELFQNAICNRIVHTTESGELMEIAMIAMQTAPEDRYPSVEAFIDAIKHYQRHAESVLIERQASKDLETAKSTEDYSMFARSVYGFENALRLWEENPNATGGLISARLDYANTALKKENFELGLSLIDKDNPAFTDTYGKLISGQDERNKRITRLRTLKRSVVALLIAFVVGGTIAGWNINEARKNALKEKREADRQRDKAEEQEQIAIDQRKEADKQRDVAKQQTKVAEQEKEKADQQRQIAEGERTKATEAAAAEKLAKEEALRDWYFALINLAGQSVEQNAFDSARGYLKQIRNRLDSEDIDLEKEIGWEFKRLEYVCGLGDGKLEKDSDNRIGTDKDALTAVAVGTKFMATSNIRGEVDLWTANTPQQFAKSIKIPGRPTRLAFSPDSSILAVGDSNGLITLWESSSGDPKGELKGHSADITRLLFLPEAQLVSTSADRDIRIWSLDDKTSIVLKGHTDAILSLARIANAKDQTTGLVTGDSNRGEIRLWTRSADQSDSWSFSKVLLANEATGISALATELRGDNDELLTVFFGTEDGSLKAIRHRKNPKTAAKDETTSLVRQPTDRHRGQVTGLLVDPGNPDQLISTGDDNTIRTWNVTPSTLFSSDVTRILSRETIRGHGNAIVDIAAWKDDATGATRILTASKDGSARMWRPGVSQEMVAMGGLTLDREAGAYGEIHSVSVGGDRSDRIIGISNDGVARIWTDAKSLPITLREGHRFLTQSAVFSKNVMVTVSFDGTAAVWDTASGSMIERWRDIGTTGVLACSADGTRVITGYASAHDAKNGKNLQIWLLDEKVLQGATGKKRTVVTVGKEVKQEGKSVNDSPSAIAICANGAWAVAGTENGFLNLIDLRKNEVQSPVDAHIGSLNPESPAPEGVSGVVFHSDTDLASSGLDGKLRFWTIREGILQPHPTRSTFTYSDGGVTHRVVGMVVSADGHRIAARLSDGRTGPRDPKSGERQKNPDFRQIWVNETGDADTKTIAKLQPWTGTRSTNGERVSAMSLSVDGQKLLATIILPRKDSAAEQQCVLREFTDLSASSPSVKDVLASSKGFDFHQASYLPGDSDRIAILSDTITSVRKRTSLGTFQGEATAVFGPTLALQACDVSHDGKLAVTVSDVVVPADEQNVMQGNDVPRLRGEIRVWGITGSEGKRLGGLLLDGAVRSISLSPVDANLILIGGNLRSRNANQGFSAELYRWNGTSLEFVQSLGNHAKGILRCRFSADGQRIVTASIDGDVQIFANKDKEFAQTAKLDLSSRLGDLVAVDLSDDGKYLLAADKSTAIVVNAQTGDLIVPSFGGHSSDLTDVKFASRSTPDTPIRIWTTSLDGSAKFWGVRTSEQADGSRAFSARQLLTLRGHQRGILALALLPDGGVVTAGRDGQVILWPVGQTN